MEEVEEEGGNRKEEEKEDENSTRREGVFAAAGGGREKGEHREGRSMYGWLQEEEDKKFKKRKMGVGIARVYKKKDEN